MSIKKGEKITASEISNLKQAVIDIYAARPNLGGTSTSGAQYTVSSINANSSGFGSDETKRAIVAGNTINANFYYALNALLQLNDVKTIDDTTPPVTIISSSNTTGDHIFKDVNENKDLMTIVNGWKDIPQKTPDNISTRPASCRGGCVGLCWNHCDSTCTYDCYAGTFGAAGDEGSSSYPGWDLSCQTSCVNNCGSSCMDACKEQCKNGCLHACTTGCGSGCGLQCTGGCRDACKGCGDTCSSGCSTGCGDDCDTGCAVGCRTNPGRL